MRPSLPSPAALLLLAVLLYGFVFPVGDSPSERLLALPDGAGGSEEPPWKALVVAGGGAERLSKELVPAGGGGVAERLSKELVPAGGGGVAARLSKELVAVRPSKGLLVKPAFRSATPSRAVPELDPGIGSGRSLHIHDNGTIELVDSRSRSTLWQLSTGSPLPSIDHVITSRGNLDHFYYPGEGSDLYEVIRGTRIVKHPLTLEEFVSRTPQVRGSVVTIGSKTSTTYVVNADTGEIIYKHSLPAASNELGGPIGEETPSKLDAGSGARSANIIMIVRTDYSLSSLDLGKPLYNWTRSYFIAKYLPKHDHQDMLEESTCLQGKIPVRCIKTKADKKLKLLLPANSTNGITLNDMDGVASGDDAQMKQVQPFRESSGATHLLLLPANSTNGITLNDADGVASGDDAQTLKQVQPFPESSGATHLLLLPANSTNGITLNDMVGVASGNDAQTLKQVQPFRESSGATNASMVLNNADSNTDSKSANMSSKHVYLVFAVVAISMAFIVYCMNQTDPDKSVMQLMEPMTYVKKLMNLRGKRDGTPKKRKARKKDGTVNSPERFSAFEKENSGTDRPMGTPFNEKYTLIKSMKPLDGCDGRWVGKLFVSNVEIGRGSNGTVVLEGFYDGRPVAVKRLLHSHNDIALKEIQNLIASDQDPNIVRLYGVEQDYDFVYISLERCSGSLADLIQQYSGSSSRDSTSDCETTISIQSNRLKVMAKDMELWRPDGLPSVQLLKLMRDVVAGLVHLHRLGIIHRDLKPQNVLIKMEGSMRAKLSDMGISKRLQEDMSSLSRHATGSGSSGWQAPEQLIHGRQTRALDLFSLGCVLFYCITKGKHPFGEYFERDTNIINNRFDLFVVDYIPEAVHLLSQLLHPDPEMRPTAVYVFHHPLFWSPELRLSFLRDMSDRIDKANEPDLLNALESIGPVAFGGKWGEKLDAALIADMGRYRKYNFDSTRDLLRLIRNKSGHYRELPAELQESLGSLPEGFDRYFSSRFPKLLIEVYKVMCVRCKEEEAFGKYLKGSLV